jgi:hypothetical protein
MSSRSIASALLELLNPKRVAARKVARMIAKAQIANPAPAEVMGLKEPASQAPKYDSLETLLEQELNKYGISLSDP